jgi:CheY-like chemotaxis protein
MATSPIVFRILVAEDNPINQKVAAILLGRAGYQVDIVENGQEAVEACLRTEYGLILMDLHMPTLDGVAAARQIRQRRGWQVKIVALTADAHARVREACCEAGMDDYLLKPYTPEQLISVADKFRNEALSKGTVRMSAAGLK